MVVLQQQYRYTCTCTSSARGQGRKRGSAAFYHSSTTYRNVLHPSKHPTVLQIRFERSTGHSVGITGHATKYPNLHQLRHHAVHKHSLKIWCGPRLQCCLAPQVPYCSSLQQQQQANKAISHRCRQQRRVYGHDGPTQRQGSSI